MRFSLTLTREGLRFLLLLGIVAFAAYNNQNNVLYLMLSMGIASVVVSFAAGALSIVRIDYEDSEQPEAFADSPFRERVVLKNRSRLLAAFGLRVDGESALVSRLAPGESGDALVERLFRRRGVYPGGPLSVSTRFPLGLFAWERELRASRELTVFPRVRKVEPSLLARLRGSSSHRADRRGHGDEVYRLRDYVPGDHVRHVHWKATARNRSLVVREFGSGHDERLCLALATGFPADEDASSFEHLVTAAASLSTEWARAGAPFRFLVDSVELAPRAGADHRREVLTHLAKVAPRTELEPAFVRNAEAAARSGERVVVLAIGPVPELGDVGVIVDPHDALAGVRRTA